MLFLCAMETEIDELESIISDYFGRTPVNSQEDEIDQSLNFSDGENQLHHQDVDQRVLAYLSEDLDEDNSNEHSPHSLNCSDGEDASSVDGLSLDPDDTAKVESFFKSGCGCARNCHLHVDKTRLKSHILSVREMTKPEKELYLIGCLDSGSSSELTSKGKKRKRSRGTYKFAETQVCFKTFSIANCIGKAAIDNLKKTVRDSGPRNRQHGNKGKRPHNALEFSDVKRIVTYIENYSDEFGLPQPAAPRGRADVAPIYLHSSTTKLHIHSIYKDSCLENGVRFAKKSSFFSIWNACLPHIKIATPRDDVCATCEKLRKKVADAISEEEKLEHSQELSNHVLVAQRERAVYRECLQRAADSKDMPLGERYSHYTFDFCQNVALPHHSRQMGPLYFLSLRKVQIFGVRIDGIGKQLNFLLDEDQTMGADGTKAHGPNTVISIVDHVLNNQGRGEKMCAVHADNCPGQNKNQFVMGYFMWRVLTGRHEKIEYHMQIPGHARCLVDSGFANIKKLYRRSDCDSLDQLEHVVNMSSIGNEAVRYPTWQWRDWKSFLQPFFRAIPGVRKYQYFSFDAATPGLVTVRTVADGPTSVVDILKRPDDVIQHAPPPPIPAAGLSPQRRQYLYRNVRPYVRPINQDELCPQPNVD